MSAHRCDVAPWLLPRERESDAVEIVRAREERYLEEADACDDEIDVGDCNDECGGW